MNRTTYPQLATNTIIRVNKGPQLCWGRKERTKERKERQKKKKTTKRASSLETSIYKNLEIPYLFLKLNKKDR